MDSRLRYDEFSIKTADNLRTVALSLPIDDVSRLSLPEIESVVERVAHLIPAGNVPGIILNGLVRLSGRKIPQKTVKRDINLLFKGVEQTLDKAIFGTFFAGPAAVIWAYQGLLKLSGIDPNDAFPEGPWQFYVDYTMREDTARHSSETHGFETLLKQHQLQLNPVDRITAWIMAAIYGLHQYHDLLANEWRERVYTRLLIELTANEPEAAHYAQSYKAWEAIRPYGRGPDALADQTYPAYRRLKFDQFLAERMRPLSATLCSRWATLAHVAEEEQLAAYQQQMSILAYLNPSAYNETRTPILLSNTNIGLIYQGHYYLIPACLPGTSHPNDVHNVRAVVSALLTNATASAVSLTALAAITRASWPQLRDQLTPPLVEALDKLRFAPILLNCDVQSSTMPLAKIRQAERGRGDHALTLFTTHKTMLFDQSHIFFDGAWGVALAEILTQEALAWATYLHRLPDPSPATTTLPTKLTFAIQEADQQIIQQTPHITPEASVETDAVDLRAILMLRRLFKQRNDLLELTVNDLLVLYRAIHAASYQPQAELIAVLQNLSRQPTTNIAGLAALKAIDKSKQMNPVIVIPVDGSQRVPKDRLYPLTFEVPLNDLDLLNYHKYTIMALDKMKQSGHDTAQAYTEFDEHQRTYLKTLAAFGKLSSNIKEMAKAGETASMGTLKLLAYMPSPLQRLLEQVPGRFDVLNDLIKGREVFSNVGAVVPGSTLSRFISAKDDNDKKELVWGILTDAQGVMHISLRDFRPHVALLIRAGQADVANQMTQHYLDTYVHGLNGFIRDLLRIALVNRQKAEQSYE